MELNSEDRKQFIDAVKKVASRQIDDAQEVGNRRFETHEDAEKAMAIAQEVAPDRKFEIGHANGKYFVEIK
ncbi:hypothetical protein [Levilactobacillus bambusae]|uniref:Uncharacterized protein n=1 Tax=Levilactobacillus bambusae TaxID=2024736 RepID=A0A2V1N6R8_9LACO|nr:hypothetical protein [Levilactobacillus bambusae]PWG01100.1 hypothetical protein DCM90_02690 [Levilactobacillus bambusae]